MKLIEKPYKNFCIYELDEDERTMFNNKFAVSQGEFSDWYLKEHGSFEALKSIKPYEYGGFFETRLEAFYHIKLTEMKLQLDKIEYALKDIKITPVDWR